MDRTYKNNDFYRTSFKHGWDELRAANHLNVGDTCFFSVIHEATCNDDGDDEWEEE